MLQVNVLVQLFKKTNNGELFLFLTIQVLRLGFKWSFESKECRQNKFFYHLLKSRDAFSLDSRDPLKKWNIKWEWSKSIATLSVRTHSFLSLSTRKLHPTTASIQTPPQEIIPWMFQHIKSICLPAAETTSSDPSVLSDSDAQPSEASPNHMTHRGVMSHLNMIKRRRWFATDTHTHPHLLFCLHLCIDYTYRLLGCACAHWRHNSEPSGAESGQGLGGGGSHRRSWWRASLYCQVCPPHHTHTQTHTHTPSLPPPPRRLHQKKKNVRPVAPFSKGDSSVECVDQKRDHSPPNDRKLLNK